MYMKKRLSEISIILPVFNCENTIQDALDSISCQTFHNFELIIIDDGSTDNTLQKIAQFKLDNFLLVKNNHDFVQSLNRGIELASGKYIARMDSDDIMEPNRLAIQYEIMERYPKITVCGSWIETFGEYKEKVRGLKGFIYHPIIFLLKGNFLVHPTVMIRKKFLVENKIRYQDYIHAEDYKMWSEIAKKNGIFYIIPKFLLRYRLSSTQISSKYEREQLITALKLRQEIMDFFIKSYKLKDKRLENILYAIENLPTTSISERIKLCDVFFDVVYNIYLS